MMVKSNSWCTGDYSVMMDMVQVCKNNQKHRLPLIIFFDSNDFLIDMLSNTGEALNEDTDLRLRKVLTFDEIDSSMPHVRSAQQRLYKPITLFFSRSASSPSDWINNFKTSFEPVIEEMPENVELLTLQRLDQATALIRLHHIYGVCGKLINIIHMMRCDVMCCDLVWWCGGVLWCNVLMWCDLKRYDC